MSSWYTFKCNKCSFTFNTSGPDEFYRDKKGMMKPYGHPVPMSKEAEKRGIYGLTADVYCMDCKKNIRDFILVEYKKPVPDDEKVWMWAGLKEPKKKYKVNKPCCPECGKSHLIFEPSTRKILCPVCNKREISGKCTIMS